MNRSSFQQIKWTQLFPPVSWLADYRLSWLSADAIAGITLAAYAIPVSLAYAALAGLPPQVGISGYLLGGVGYALLGSSRQLAVGSTSAISLMIASSVGAMAAGDPIRYAQIASLAACEVALLCLIAWLFKLSVLVRLVSDSILVGFKAGAGLTIIMTQLPSLFGVAGGGHNFFDRAMRFAGQLVDFNSMVLVIGLLAILLLLLGERILTGKPVGLAVVALSILLASMFGLPSLGIPVTGKIPEGLPGFELPALGLLEFQELFPIAAGCLLLAYIKGASAARSFATKHGYRLDVRQEFLGLGAANLVTALVLLSNCGWLQSAVNDAAGARTPLALVFCSMTLSLCLLFFTGFYESSQGRIGCHCLYRRVQTRRRPRAGAYVANQPDRFLCRGDSAYLRAAASNPARRPACGHRIHIPAAGSRVASEHRVSRTPFRNRPLFG